MLRTAHRGQDCADARRPGRWTASISPPPPRRLAGRRERPNPHGSGEQHSRPDRCRHLRHTGEARCRPGADARRDRVDLRTERRLSVALGYAARPIRLLRAFLPPSCPRFRINKPRRRKFVTPKYTAVPPNCADAGPVSISGMDAFASSGCSDSGPRLSDTQCPTIFTR